MFRRVEGPNQINPKEQNWTVLIRNLKLKLEELIDQVNTQIQDVGVDLPATATFKPSNAIHVVTGTGVIDTIVAPVGFSGFIRLVAAEAWTISVAGNVALPVTPAVGESVLLDYIPKLGKWFPIARSAGGGGGTGPTGPRGPAGPPGFALADPPDDCGCDSYLPVGNFLI